MNHIAEDCIHTWYTHFKNLLSNPTNVLKEDENIPTILTGIDKDDGPLAMQDWRKWNPPSSKTKVQGRMGYHQKSKNCDLNDLLLSICNRALTLGKIPSQWSVSTIIPVPKSGTLTKADNYCRISLTCIFFKLTNQMILNQIRKATDREPKL